LKAGYVDKGVFHDTKTGTRVRYDYRGLSIGSRIVVRYADDFVLLCESKEDAHRAKYEVSNWLAQRGLQLSEEKTRIVHITEGFDFLGFNVRHYKDPFTKTGYKLLIKPSVKAINWSLD
jgi:RNA-directed DNA polymerase